MTYTIKITNKNTDPNSKTADTIYFDNISPSLIIDPDTPYAEFINDMTLRDGSICIPLWERQQFVRIPPNSVLIINTDDSSEAIYYRQMTVNNTAILVDPDPIQGSSGGGTLIEKTITENGTYLASQDDADGYSLVDVNVPNSYVAQDEGKVVSNGTLISQLTHKPITTNGTGIDTTIYSSVDVDVPNTYTSEDNGKVVNNETLVSQTAYPTTITQNDTYDTTNYNRITVNVSSGGGTGGSDVIFYDYDGTVVASYSAADFANLSAMPANPTHAGLTAQGWNWSLADAKTYVAANGKLNIGQMYITSDGKTRLYCVIPKDNLILDLYLYLDEDTELDIDWGDDSEHETWTYDEGEAYKLHTYSDGGNYTVAITVVQGGFGLADSDGRYGNRLKRVEFGSGVTTIDYQTFYECNALSSITIPNSVASIDEGAFSNCSALSSITIPDSVTSIGVNAFYECSALSFIAIPNSVTSIDGNTFERCSALSSITIPDSVDSIGEYAFSGCSSLSSITIPDSVTTIWGNAFYECSALSSITIPDSVTTIDGYTFYGCSSLSSITIPDSVDSIGDGAFYGCSALSTITIPNSVITILGNAFEGCNALSSITIPDSITSIGDGAFSGCSALSSITIPDSVTSIGGSIFSSCSALSSITIPDSITTIGDGAFSNCSALSSITFESTTPPDLSGDLYIETACVIRVPQGTLSDYTSASNYPDPATYIYVEY